MQAWAIQVQKQDDLLKVLLNLGKYGFLLKNADVSSVSSIFLGNSSIQNCFWSKRKNYFMVN